MRTFFGNSSLEEALSSGTGLMVKQRRELGELFGFETRNKYELLTFEGKSVGFCAEQQKGLLGILFRQVLGHWRRFNLIMFDADRKPLFKVTHPFRFFFQRLELQTMEGEKIGALQQRFGILTKKFDIQGPDGSVIGRMRSGLFKLWTFPVTNQMGEEVGKVEKKWGGALKEIFTDQDTFRVSFRADLSSEEKLILVASAVFIDLKYFENNQGASPLSVFD
jgi:uncharacterized protein YxjI